MSDNFIAEMLLKQLGARGGERGTSAARRRGRPRRRSRSAGVPLAGVRLADGSGLSSLDRLTARALSALLRAAWADPDVRPYFARRAAGRRA